MTHLPFWILVLSQLSTIVIGSPIYAPQFLSGGTGRNIRHLPCVSLKTSETGVCMFALTCVKANGTHLGTCIDRFYFGSCCKLNDEPEIYPEDNTIDETPPSSRPHVTTDSAIESNDIPDHFTRPKPLLDHKPPTSPPFSSVKNPIITTQAVRPTTSTESPKISTHRPILSTPYTTTQPPMGLSTFFMVHDSNPTTTEIITKLSTSTRPQKPFTTESPTIITTNEPHFRPKPTWTTSGITKKPFVTETTTRRPSSTHVTKPAVTRRPISSTNSRPLSTTTERSQPSTRFPPRNATTTTRPVPTTTTRKPGQYTSTKKPSVTTKRPTSITRKPTTTIKPLTNDHPTGKPTITTEKTFNTNVKVTQTHRPTSTESSMETSSSSVDHATSGTIRPTQRPWTKWPQTTNNDDRATTLRPSTASSRPRPSSKPVKVSTTSTGRPSVVKTTARPQQINDKIQNSSASLPGSSSSRPTTLRPSPESHTRPRPTDRPTRPGKPTKPTKPTDKPTKPVEATRPTVITVPPTLMSLGLSSTTQSSVTESTAFVNNASTLNNEILPPKKTEITTTTTEKMEQTTELLGLITWSSNSDDDVTKIPDTVPTVSGSVQEESTEPEWSPITTPDGWIIIQSPTTTKPTIVDEMITRPKPTKTPATSAKPTTESTTTERVTTTRPTVPTTLSSIATITTADDLPINLENLNMSDYKQVCGRRLFPESRIVGGKSAGFGDWPWQISLRQWRTKAYLHKCGAALLNENWAITAAHCVENVPPSDLLLRIGEHDLANEDEPYGFQERRVQIVASHPQFDPRTFEYDLALLRFYEPIEPFQPNILPVCLPDDDENYVGHTAYVTGWGRLFEDGPLPSVLQEVSVPVVNNSLCEGMYRSAGYIEHIPHIFICAGWRKGGFDSCEGDSGGPMVIRRPRDKRWILAGVISWGIGCAEANQPGVYTRISEFREWINQILQF